MANVTVTVPTSNITVDTTNSIVNVASTSSNVVLSATAAISNADVREAITVSNVSGFGNLAYDSTSASNGIIQYTGVSTSDIRGQLSATSPMIYNSTSGDISINSSAVFSGKTTDDLAQGTTNIYFSTSGATVNTDALPEGSSNEYYTDARSRSAVSVTTATPSGDGALVYNNSTGVFAFTPADAGQSDYGNVQVADFLANGFGSNTITTTGSIAVGLNPPTSPLNVGATIGGKLVVNSIDVLVGEHAAAPGTVTIGNTTSQSNQTTVRNYGNMYTGALLTLAGNNPGETSLWSNVEMVGITQNLITARTGSFEGYPPATANLMISADRGITNFIRPHGTATDFGDNDNRFRVVKGKTPTNFDPGNADGDLVDIGADGSMIFDINPQNNTYNNGYFRVYSDRGPYTLGTPIFSVDPTAVNTVGTVTINGNATINGNLQVQGNIDYVNSEDLLVKDQSISLNVGNVVQDAMIIVDRQGAGGGANTELRWNETTDRWTFTNDGSTYNNILTTADLTTLSAVTSVNTQTGVVVLDTDDIAEGTTNEYYTDARANSAINSYATSGTTDVLTGLQSITINPASTVNKAFEVDGLGNVIYSLERSTGDNGTFKINADRSTDLLPETIFQIDGQSQGAPAHWYSTDLTLGRTDGANASIVTVGTDLFRHRTAAGGNAVFESNVLTNNVTFNSNISVTNAHTLISGPITSTAKFPADVGASSVTETFKTQGDGYAIFQGATFTNATRASYSGATNLTYYEWEGTATSGSPTLTVTAMREGSADTAATVADLNLGYVLGAGNGNFPDDAYIISIDTGAGTVTFNKNAVVSGTLAYSDGKVFSPGAIDTDTGLVYELRSELQVNGSGSYTTLRYTLPTNIIYGYPQSGPVAGDFNTYAIGTASDYSFTNVSEFTVARTNLTPANTIIKANDGIVIGQNTDLSNRGENDVFRSFGLNIMWDGTETYSTAPQPAVLFKSYTDNSQQSTIGQLGSGAPRLFFTTANGKSTDDPFSVYPRTNQELGRLSFWGSTGTQLNPSSYNVPSYMSVQAADNWDTWGGGPAGNTNVYFASTSSVSGNPDTYLAYKGGELFLGAGNSKSITLAPAAQVTGARPEEAYIGGDTVWANINYANTGSSSGSKITVNNGGSVGAGTVGDMQLSLKRVDNSSNLTTNIESILDGVVISSGLYNRPFLMLNSALSPANTLDGVLATISASGTITASSTGNETALGGNQYYLNYLFTSGATGNHGYYLTTGAPVGGGGTVVTYTSLGGASPYVSGSGDFNTIQTTPSTTTTVVSSGVTAKEWKLNVAEQSNNLALQSESVTKVEFTDNESIFSNRVRFQNLDTTAINALTGMAAGDTVYNTTEATLCFYDGSAWQKVDKTAL